jgi:LAO/AO transport system kinase
MAKMANDELVQRILEGDRRGAARLVTLLEKGDENAKEVMKRLYPHTGNGLVIGVTGGAGAGKSTLLDQLIQSFRASGKTVGALVVDPSSPFSGGAFLGDRLRMQRHTRDDGVFIRSMASKGYLGGLARATSEAIRVMEALGMEAVLVETIGAGQDEVDVIQVVQTCVLVITPAMGDEIQALKAGLMEIGDIFAINKSDLEGSNQTLRGVEAALSLKQHPEGGWRPKVVSTVATDGKGIDELMEAIYEHQDLLRQGLAMDDAHSQRIEHELGLIFKDELERIVFRGLKGTGKKSRYIKEILEGATDPYSVIEEILTAFVKKRPAGWK